jgi:hypothetical protein
MEENTGFAAFAMFNALKLHFSSKSYNYFKYNGKTNVTKDSFSKRKDKYSFYKLSRRYSILELKEYYVSNLIKKNVSWIGEIIGQDAEEVYTKWQKTNQSLTYVFKNDIEKIFELGNPDDLLRVSGGQYPKLYILLAEETITLESFVILNDILNFIPMWDKKIEDDLIWPTTSMKCEKYLPFIQYDKNKFKNILKETMHEYA